MAVIKGFLKERIQEGLKDSLIVTVRRAGEHYFRRQKLTE